MREPATLIATLVICLVLAACGAVPGSSGDGGTPDGSGSGANGVACTSGEQCLTGACVDGVCCASACSGQCEACDVDGSVGTCAPVSGDPHGARNACTGAGTSCGGTCDGVTAATCTYPTVECRAASCTNKIETAAASCNMGTCPAEVTEACTVTCGATECVTATQVTAGFYNSCALLSDGTVRCWGQNSRGQNGIPASDEEYVPVAVAGLTDVKQITTANSHTCALLNDGTAKCWGSNIYGELGIGTSDNTAHPVPAVVKNEAGTGPLTGILSMAAGQFRTCAVVQVGSSREGRCWGSNFGGAIGSGNSDGNAITSLPTPVCRTGTAGTCSRLTNIFEIATGKSHSCARIIGGTLLCWGGNNAGQLGFARDTVVHPNPITVQLGGVNLLVDTVATAIGETGDATCAVRASDKVVLCWGRNDKGQLGRGSFVVLPAGHETPSPVCRAVTGCPALTGARVGAGYYHACAISLDKVRCWGGNNSGQLGDGGLTDKEVSASDVATAANVSQMAVGEFHTCAVLIDGRVQCWGWPEAVGNNATTDVPNPTFPTW